MDPTMENTSVNSIPTITKCLAMSMLSMNGRCY
nr:unnamed protein product [Callosobruchus analis]